MDEDEARRRFAAARVARMGTVGAGGRPHLVPIVFDVAGNIVYSAVDAKPKRSTALRRLDNIAADPHVAVLVDHYDDADWAALWWVRADGTARVVDVGSIEGRTAIRLLAERYPQYRDQPPGGPVIAVDVHQWSGWAAADH